MQSIERIASLSERELATLGVHHVAYVKRVLLDGASLYAVHAADGTQIALLPNRDIAYAIVRQHNMEPVNVH